MLEENEDTRINSCKQKIRAILSVCSLQLGVLHFGDPGWRPARPHAGIDHQTSLLHSKAPKGGCSLCGVLQSCQAKKSAIGSGSCLDSLLSVRGPQLSPSTLDPIDS